MQVVLLSGVSGSGKSVALRALEDSHFFAVDNLPADLILTLVDYAGSRGEPKVAISADARSRESLGRLPQIVEELGKRGHDVRVIFLDSNDESLVRRFSETRRPHPLAREGQALAEAIAEERRVLAWLAEIGQRIDTGLPWLSDLTVFAYADYGAAWNSPGSPYEFASLASAGAGVRAVIGENLIATALVAQPLYNESQLDALGVDQSTRLRFSLSLRF